jgi:ABC-2 type transport system ATP-binding protein/lipopolysaccharide transport system ATP-binding protein
MNLPIVSDAPLVIANHHPELAVELQNVSVRYRVPREHIGTFKEYAIRRIQRRISHDEFWALRNVNVQVYRGEVFGIIGRNGAGKSTLLKVVARVLRPTEGRVWIKGNVAPLLEFGAGFHAELSGRENIFLNGALLGFTRKQMEEKFERIVDFAELGEFIDAPLRTYSSGMVARLGFAIATDVKPDVLILDEVLAVGDEAFQHKCEERMREFRNQGATILLVTHNVETIKTMCERAMWLDHGVVQAQGAADQVVAQYHEAFSHR